MASLWFRRLALVLMGFAPVSCHYAITAPRLWAHNSSAAFEAWVAMWVFSLIFLVACVASAIYLREQHATKGERDRG